MWRQAAGAGEWEAVLSVDDSDATLVGLAAGQRVKLRVTAVNEAGESAPGDEVEALVA